MKEIIINEKNLTANDIDKRTIKSRVFIINDQEEVIIAHYADLYLLPGGKVGKNETPLNCLKREVKEETGIDLIVNDENLLFLIKYFIKDYPPRKEKDEKYNRLIETYYYLVKDNSEIKKHKLNLTKSELKKGFSLKRVKLKELADLITNHKSTNSRHEIFVKELLIALESLN